MQRTEFEERTENVSVKVFRYDSSSIKKAKFDTFIVPVKKGMTLLESLLYIKERLDPSFTFRYSCRMGICGSCGLVVNGKEKLACKTQMETLGKSIEVRPLNNMPLIRDLVVDFSSFLEKHKKVKPYIIREDVDKNPDREFKQLPEEVNNYLIFADCTKCGLCYSACPTNATDELYLGPQALTQAYRFIADSRDDGQMVRMNIVDTNHGIWNCHFAGSCTDVCPKGVDPAFAIQQLKTLAIRKSGFLKKKRPAAPIDKRREIAEHS
ncbi:MAG: succinate dehydrogenase iron-sulfur subunit [Conexivisphaerales archaeon]